LGCKWDVDVCDIDRDEVPIRILLKTDEGWLGGYRKEVRYRCNVQEDNQTTEIKNFKEVF